MRFIIFLILLITCGCQQTKQESSIESPSETSFNWQKINSRDEGEPSVRYPLYVARVPSDWIRIDPKHEESIEDTTLPLVTFIIDDGKETVKIFVHNFPSDNIDHRIPPMSQVQRWLKQFTNTIENSIKITPTSHSGFVGFFVQAEGLQNNRNTMLLGWAMQLAPEYFRKLNQSENYLIKQKRADYTIKAIGSPHLMQKNKNDIIEFADSFELAEELPPL